VASIDVLRAQVQHQTERQRLIAAENAAAKRKLALARAIGLPVGQAFVLRDAMPEAVAAVPLLEDAVTLAYANREDLKAQESEVRAAEAAAKSAAAERLPSVAVAGNWGPIGQTAATAIPTYTVGAFVHVPIFNAGRAGAHAAQAAATLGVRRAELEAARATVHYEVETALLDLDAARQLVDVASRAVTLAQEQLTHARDRFAAGVVDTIEVVQAQEALASALDSQIASLYSYNAAKAGLATAIGLAEEEMPRFLGVSQP
jgi:outer membrane protein TolC